MCFGLCFRPAPELSLWIELQGNDVAACDAIFGVASRGALTDVWQREREGKPPWIGASLPVAGDLVQEDAIRWLTARVGELADAGVLAELPKWRRQDRSGEDD